MPKLKTSKTASKRISKITKSGKLLRRKTLSQHLVHRKANRTIKRSGEDMQVTNADEQRIKKLIPYRTK
jgi:ribosomal protein L35